MHALPRCSRTLTALAVALLTTGCGMDYKLMPDGDDATSGPSDRGTAIDPDDPGSVVPAEPAEPTVDDTGIVETPDEDRPEAICRVSPAVVRPIHDTALWKGRGFDPSGYAIVDYDWALISAPAGSSADMVGTSQDEIVFQADVAGVYTAELVVTNEMGVESEPCQVDLEAIPGQALWIEMFWTLSGDDMDLHLLAPGGTFQTESDCHFDNCVPEEGGLDWGTAGDVSDDAFLDMDDISGTGPENINIEDPKDGLYRVVVHDWPDSVRNESNMVTINVYLDGEKMWTDTRAIAWEDSVTEFAVIDVTNGLVQGLPEGG